MNHLIIAAALSTACLLPATAPAQGMPPEARKNIHALFNNHESITRSLTMTEKGYIAVTESKDPKIAAALKAHVKQMGDRLKSGRMVRRWDPAFAEYVRHNDDIDHEVTPTEHGLKMVVTGKTPAAVKVAQNHANIILNFVRNGWAEHDKEHPVAAAAPAPASTTDAQPACCRGAGCPRPCCARTSNAKDR